MTGANAPVPDAGASAAPAAGLAPVEVAVAAPVVAEAAPAVVEAAPATPATPAVVETPAAVEVPAVEPAAPAEPEAKAKAKAETKPEPAAPERPKTLLEKADEERAAKEADKAKKPDDAAKKPGEEAKPDETAKPLEGEILPLDFKWPENLKVVPEQVEAFTDALRSAKTGDLKEVGQQLIALHESAITSYAEAYQADAWKVWNDLIASKDKAVLADPVIGGAGHQTAMAAIVRMRDLLVPENERAEFTEMLNVTGVGSWPPFLRMLHRSAEIFDEPPMPPPGGKPPSDAHLPRPTGGRLGLLHDHPTSQPNAGRS